MANMPASNGKNNGLVRDELHLKSRHRRASLLIRVHSDFDEVPERDSREFDTLTEAAEYDQSAAHALLSSALDTARQESLPLTIGCHQRHKLWRIG